MPTSMEDPPPNRGEELKPQQLYKEQIETLRYMLDRKITQAEEKVQALKDSKKRLDERGVLDCRVRDLRIAMYETY